MTAAAWRLLFFGAFQTYLDFKEERKRVERRPIREASAVSANKNLQFLQSAAGAGEEEDSDKSYEDDKGTELSDMLRQGKG